MARKSPNTAANPQTSTHLARDLGFWAALSIGVGTMIGAGIFVLPGIVASKAGPAVLLSFLSCGILSILIALCMTELATGMPYSGGGYLFIVRSFGPLIGSMMGWCLWLSLIFASAFYMIGFGYYLSDAFGVSPTLIALGMMLLLVLLNYIGARETGGTQTVIVIILLIILALFVLRALFSINLGNLVPFVPPEIGFSGVLITLPILFITFMGFAEIAAISEEIRNPSQNLPRSIVGSVVVVTLIYCAVVFCLLALRAYNDPNMAKETVLMEVARELTGGGGYGLILLGGILATVSSANASIMAASRISFAMGRDQLMPDWLNQIHLRFKTPYRSILVTGGLTMLILIILGTHLELLAEVAGFLSLVLYSLITIGSMVMRGSKVDWYKPTFKTPGFPVVPLLGLLGCVFVMVNTSRLTLIIGYLILAGSFVWYWLFLRKGTQLVGASSIIWQQKILKPLAVRAEDYISTRREVFPVILVPLANPETEKSLLKLSTSIARGYKARLRLIHVIDVPMQTPLEAGRIAYEKKREEKETLLDVASRHATEQGVRAMASAIVAHNIPSAILSAAEMESPDFIVMGWKGEAKTPQLRRTNVADVLRLAKGNVLVLKDRGIEDVRRILVPLGGGPHAQLGLRLASELALEWKASITTLNVQVGRGLSDDNSDFERQSVALFKEHAEEYGKGLLDEIDVEAEMRVEIGEDIAQTIVKTSEEYELIVMGASNEWALRQRLFGSLPDNVADHSSISVLMVRAKQ
jgi:amino acid transporter/nucleotide-binding universal stress UspA family protein